MSRSNPSPCQYILRACSRGISTSMTLIDSLGVEDANRTVTCCCMGRASCQVCGLRSEILANSPLVWLRCSFCWMIAFQPVDSCRAQLCCVSRAETYSSTVSVREAGPPRAQVFKISFPAHSVRVRPILRYTNAGRSMRHFGRGLYRSTKASMQRVMGCLMGSTAWNSNPCCAYLNDSPCARSAVA